MFCQRTKFVVVFNCTLFDIYNAYLQAIYLDWNFRTPSLLVWPYEKLFSIMRNSDATHFPIHQSGKVYVIEADEI